ncbi:putative transcriptional regulator [Inquilinus ginsengisoli]|uniref:Transcriptional regulator n=1 Tax=Inquilinus ginsengisoli TaxID=363840 RepID=A0ABU1K081_9PROT|nr:antitoxin of toxin-antitoxin stability system [Inquilinus ginsengisoli]MDR6294277.1 putative transcriptional regulator [Inquilinus ginsengisoli]
MSKEAMFTLKLESELREQFMAEAAATHRPASQIIREFMRDFVTRQRAAREHDAWFRAEVEQGMREADNPTVERIPQEDVSTKWRRQRAELMKRAGERTE